MTIITDLTGSYFDGQVTEGDIGILPTFDRVQSAEDEAILKRSTFGDTFSNNAETPTPFEVSADGTLTITIAKGSGYAAGYFGALLEDTTFSVPPNISGANQVHGIFFRTDINNSVRRCQLVFKENDITEIKDIDGQSIQELRIAQISMINGALVIEQSDVINSTEYWRYREIYDLLYENDNLGTGEISITIPGANNYKNFLMVWGPNGTIATPLKRDVEYFGSSNNQVQYIDTTLNANSRNVRYSSDTEIFSSTNSQGPSTLLRELRVYGVR